METSKTEIFSKIPSIEETKFRQLLFPQNNNELVNVSDLLRRHFCRLEESEEHFLTYK